MVVVLLQCTVVPVPVPVRVRMLVRVLVLVLGPRSITRMTRRRPTSKRG